MAEQPNRVRYGLEGRIFQVETEVTVKLADYGTVIWPDTVDSSSLEHPAKISTIENAAPEMLIHGSNHSGHAVDMFQVSHPCCWKVGLTRPYAVGRALFPALAHRACSV